MDGNKISPIKTFSKYFNFYNACNLYMINTYYDNYEVVVARVLILFYL
jgi:hypothetical protein